MDQIVPIIVVIVPIVVVVGAVIVSVIAVGIVTPIPGIAYIVNGFCRAGQRALEGQVSLEERPSQGLDYSA